MVALYDPQDPKMERNDTDKTVATSSKGGGSSDEAISPMQSADGGGDGRSSTNSSPPSAGEMSYVVEDDRKEQSSTQANLEDQETPAETVRRVEQLVDDFVPTGQGATLQPSIADPSSSIQPLVLPSRAGKVVDHTISSYRSLEGSLRKNVPIAPASSPALLPLPDQVAKAASIPFSSEISLSASATASPRMAAIKSSPRLGSTKSKQTMALRRGKWTVEEEAYVARVIQDFNSGFLNAPAGTTLRTYLSEKLKCDPMRITKKFTGDACIGKRVFHPAVRTPSNAAAIDKAQAELDSLERRWRRRLDMQQRESAKKAAASAAVAAAASSSSPSGGRGLGPSNSSDMASDDTGRNPVAKTASWLDRAKSALKEAPLEEQQQTHSEALLLQDQMHEVQRLIHEGPTIQQTSADLPHMLDDEGSTGSGAAAAAAEIEPADKKRMKTAEDAEALVGFLRSVRSAAASGEEF